MPTAKVIPHGDGRAVMLILPENFQVDGDEVQIEQQGTETLIVSPARAKPKFQSFDAIARFLAEKYPDAPDFPDLPPRLTEHERPILEW